MSDTSPASPADPVTAAFEAQRDRLRQIAYRVLGSHSDAEDVVQDAWLRLSRQDAQEIHNLAGWLTTVVGRLSLDVLRTRQARPETPFDDRPELSVLLDEAASPEEDAALTDAIGLALLVVLDALSPAERLAFVLHDMFAVPFDEIGRILGKSADAAKMTASRARRKVQAGDGDRPAATVHAQREVVQAFLAATRRGDFEDLLRVLDPDVRLSVDTPDGVVVILGATQVATGARLAVSAGARGREVLVNGRPGLVSWAPDGTVLAILAFTVTGPRITAIASVTDPAKLAAMDLPEPA